MEKQFTQEQLDIINISTKMQRNESLKIQACAGSGKTSTLLEIAKANPNQNFLYLAFNKSIVEEAKKKFPQNVIVKTIHSLAYSRIINSNGYKITNKHTFDDYQGILGINNYNDFILFNQILNEFLNSSNKHFQYQMIADLFDAARQGKIPYTHSMYLKEFQLLKPEARGLDEFDFILLDEAQDTNALTLDIFVENQCKKILVGDTFQNIYGFRETINALEEIKTTYEKNLTYSFRCNQSILNRACYFLKEYGGKNVFFHSAYKENQEEKKTSAIITRTNASIIELIANIMENSNSTQKYKLIKEPESIFATSLNCYYLKNGYPEKMDKEYKWLSRLNAEELEEYIEKDLEISNAFKIVKKYGSKIFEIFEEAKNLFKAKEYDCCITNAHISKGLEWSNVKLYEDFPSLRELERELEELKHKAKGELLANKKLELTKKLREETNLYYVALKRAKDYVVDKTHNDFEYKNFLASLEEKTNSNIEEVKTCEEMILLRKEYQESQKQEESEQENDSSKKTHRQ